MFYGYLSQILKARFLLKNHRCTTLQCKIRNNYVPNLQTSIFINRKYTQALSELSDLRDDIEKSRREFQNCQHIRQIIKTDESYDDTNPVPDQMEKEIQEALSLKEEQLNDCIEKCHVALIDFKTLLDELNTGKKALEDTFQVLYIYIHFCTIRYYYKYLQSSTYVYGSLSLSNVLHSLFRTIARFTIK